MGGYDSAVEWRSGYESESSECSEDSAAYEDISTTTKGAGPRKVINKGRWTKEEDKRLKAYVKLYEENWEKVASQFSDRSDVQCHQRWTKVVNPELVKGPWTKECLTVRLTPKYWHSRRPRSNKAPTAAGRRDLHQRSGQLCFLTSDISIWTRVGSNARQTHFSYYGHGKHDVKVISDLYRA
ncbi:Transcription factor MYB3R-4 [Eumeta japonica]|uniref:Transcription factor MYB3R-4 n=1 Tax=Eumeta variegata TaxID=151549 RepID=A0A4C1VF95_EUMVA|nr:Transcription factor MYB3R-4 [Eumeta japonica]